MLSLIKPMLLEPKYRDYVWGGSRLKPGSSPVAEAWVVYESDTILSGALAGKTLAEAAESAPEALLGEKAIQTTGKRFPLLIKLLDCAQWLSLQVHPDNEMAVKLEGPGQFGKAEAWHFIETAPNAEILSGLKPGTTPQALAEAIRQHTVLQQMQHLYPKAGDSIFIHPRMIHALGPGLLVYEVQQTSDWTYRVWDWDRPATPNRPLHIEKSLAAADPALTGALIPAPASGDGLAHLLLQNTYFSLFLLEARQQSLALDTGGETFHAITVIRGAARLEGNGWQQPLGLFQTALVPADAGQYRLFPEGDCQALKAQPAA
jgi:mannose-6-phosphate isomerase